MVESCVLQAVYLDIHQDGMTWSTLDYGQFPLRNCLIMLVVDFLLYGALAVYCDNVIPSESSTVSTSYQVSRLL